MSAFNVHEKAVEYESWDPNAECKEAIAALRVAGKTSELEALLGCRLEFGTAGLRGPMGAGYNRMNELVVLQTTQGLIRYMDSLDSSAKAKGVVIGYDHRNLGTLSSKGFARITAAVLLSQGYKIYLLEEFVATPLVAFGVNFCGCAAGIMVTASHNPKQDNGFKVYWNNGSQIIPPHDTGIATAILANLQPWQVYDTADSAVLTNALTEDATGRVADAYFQAISSRLATRVALNSTSTIKAVYTAMHGVGCKWVKAAFAHFDHVPLNPVPLQSEPDASFPTVKFPNPEEKGALDQSIVYADAQGATLILANDPDADRLAVAEKDGATGWKIFSGNELGVLLGHWQIMAWKSTAGPNAAQPAVLASVVSSRMLKAVASAEGVLYQDTLTGFKWLGDSAIRLRVAGTPVLFTYEEALGYCVGDVLCDKDGVSAACVFLEMASALAERGLTVKQHLQGLYSKYGEFVSYNSYVISHDKTVTERIFSRLRNGGPNGKYWTHCAGVKIVVLKDITKGYDSSTSDGKSVLPVTPDSHMIMFEFANGCSVTLRTSGTEPKIKFYTEIAGMPGQPRSEAEASLFKFVDVLVNEMLQPDENNLIRA